MTRHSKLVPSICLILAFPLLPSSASSTDDRYIVQHHHQLKETTSSERCTVCLDGSPVTNPTGELDVPGFGIQSCSVISTLAGTLYPLEDPNCQLLQSVSTVCGCPSSATNPCQLCGDGNRVPQSKLSLPLSYLDETVNYEGVNCQLLEIYFNSSVESDHLTCQLKQAWTKEYCCSADEWVPPTNPCHICVENQDSILDLGEPLKCSQVQEAALTLWEASDPYCQQTQSVSKTLCGCQSDANTATGDEKDIPMCTLCKDGSNVTTPAKLVPFMADRFFGIEPTCQQLDDITRAIAKDSQDCADAQLIGSYCGCPAVENACVFCPKPGDAITTPTRKHSNFKKRYGQEVTCEQVEAVLLQFTQYTDECFLGQEHNWECGCNDGFYGYLGTESESDISALHWAARISSFLSLCGSLFIMQDFFRGNDKRNLYRQIMVLMSGFDFVTAIGWMVGSAPIPTKDPNGYDTNILGAQGNDALCTVQGFFVMLGYGSGFFNNSLSIYYVLIVVYGWKDHQLKKARPWLLAVPVLCACIQAFTGIPFYESIWIGCWVLPRPYTDDWTAFGFSFAPIVLTAIFSTACQIRVYWSVRKTVRKGRRWSMSHRLSTRSMAQFSTTSRFDNLSPEQETEEEKKARFNCNCNCIKNSPLLQDNPESAVFWQSVFYLFTFYISWPILMVGVMNAKSQNFGFWLALSIMAPSQGFLNCLVYTRPRIIKLRRSRNRSRNKASRETMRRQHTAVTATSQSPYSSKRFIQTPSRPSEEEKTPSMGERIEEGSAPAAADGTMRLEDMVDIVPAGSAWDRTFSEQ